MITKADHAGCGEQLAQCTVIGTYVTKAAACCTAGEGTLPRRRRVAVLEGHGYHQGEGAESAIEIERAGLHLEAGVHSELGVHT